jgi:hypothetical protein
LVNVITTTIPINIVDGPQALGLQGDDKQVAETPPQHDPLVEPLRYINDQDIHMRLFETFVRYRGDVFKVVNVRHEPSLTINLYNERYDKSCICHSSSALLDISSLPPRYVLYKKQTFWFRRIPHRRQKQGVYYGNIKAKVVNSGEVINGDFFLECYYNEDAYNFCPEILDRLVSQDLQCYPVSPNLCFVQKSTNVTAVYYKDIFYGIYNKEKNHLQVMNKLLVSEVLKHFNKAGVKPDVKCL